MGKKLWLDAEVHLLIHHLSENLSAFTTGVKERFYVSSNLRLKADDYVKSTTQIKTKLKELEGSLMEYKLNLSRSGFGLKENDPPGIKAMLKKGPHFYDWDEIMGFRHNITPPVLMEPGHTHPHQQRPRGGTTADSVAARDDIVATTDDNDAITDDASTLRHDKVATAEAPIPLETVPPAPVVKRRPFSAVHPSNLHDAIYAFMKKSACCVRSGTRKIRSYKQDSSNFQQQSLELQRQELRMREKKMDQQFELQRIQLALERERLNNRKQK
ncbi:TPA: hypothetical protein N0F65_011732 [Lagenidium giganteum]|uniref:Uncharacterized protein n=1 Tax=Lagenidium giganteum TaxID=4803 RepID=A0AAV2YDM2_9STRA|nr:TPA: hypothetical protein N0F65_011732 [Lagenidium giganteum]